MPKIRVLVVDDSSAIRKLLVRVLTADAATEVAGLAENGRVALSMLDQARPDLVILDVDMPEMDGIETLTHLRRTHPRLPVLMFSALTERGAAVTVEALVRGASDYVHKPTAAGGAEATWRELLSKVKALAPAATAPAVTRPRTDHPPAAAQLPPPRPQARLSGAVGVVVIGTSTGGPAALATVLTELPREFAVPILVVQHMPANFTAQLAERLRGQCRLNVAEAVPEAPVRPGTIWIAPGAQHLVLYRAGTEVRLQTNLDPPENFCRPSVDVLLRSAARIYGAGTLGVILTGIGQDGLRGCEAVKQAGGQVLAQDQASSVVWGMPGFVAGAFLADKVLPLPQIAGEIVRRVKPCR